MSGSISGFGGGNLGQLSALVADNETITARLDHLQQQASTGYIAPTLGGLGGTSARQVLDLRPQVAQNAQYQANINTAQGQLSTTQSALSSISTIASQFYADIPKLSDLAPSEIDLVAQQAQQALSQVGNLIDTKDGNTYVFAGQTPSKAPITDPNALASSTFATSIASQVAGLATNGGPATAAATLNAAVANSPFDPALSSAVPTVQVGQSAFVQAGVLANKNTLATSSGSSTTGSYMTDILRGLATLASLKSSQVDSPGFPSLVQDTAQSLGSAISTLNDEAGALGNIQSGLTAKGTELDDMQTALKSQLSSATDVDMAATLTSLTQTQTQLQASYQVIASTKTLSLVNYL